MSKAGRGKAFLAVIVLVLIVGGFFVMRNRTSGRSDESRDQTAQQGGADSGSGAGGGSGSGGGHRRHRGGGGGDASGGGDSGGDGQGGTAVSALVTPVQVATVQDSTIAATVPVTGNISALQDVQLSAKDSARVTFVVGLEGTEVHSGEVVVQQDTADLQQTVRQDQAQLAKDQAAIDQANQNYQIQVIQAKQNVLNAQAALSAARQTYLKYLRGNRPQDILQAEAATMQAKATMDNAKITVDRDKILLDQGAIPKSQYDTDSSNYEVDQALYKKAQAAEAEEKEGYQKEDIAAQREQVRQQETNLKNQLVNQRNIAVRRADIESAEATLKQDQAKMAYDQQQVDFASIRSSINGIVAARETEVGQMATPGTNVLRVVNVDRLYFQPTISETDYSRTRVGDTVQVKVDALAGQTFTGHIAALFPAADTTTRVFSARVVVDNPHHLLRPGMFARGTLVTSIARQVPVIPTSALVSSLSQQGFEANTSSNAPIAQGVQLPPQSVVVVRPDNTAEVRQVTLGIVTMDRAQVKSGLNPGETIVVVGQQGLKTGDKLNVPSASPAAPTSSASASSPSSATVADRG